MDTSNTQAARREPAPAYNYRPDSDLYIIYNVGTTISPALRPANLRNVRKSAFAVKWTYSFAHEAKLDYFLYRRDSCGGSRYKQVPKLHAGTGVVILQSNVTLQSRPWLLLRWLTSSPLSERLMSGPAAFDFEGYSIHLAPFDASLSRAQVIDRPRHMHGLPVVLELGSNPRHSI